jgi:hypothetical protein
VIVGERVWHEFLAQRFEARGITFAFITKGNVKIELMSAAWRTEGAAVDNIGNIIELTEPGT